jgi:outer membrane protein assembly factor BamB
MVMQSTAGAARLGVLLLAGLLSGCGMIPWIGADKDPTPPTKLTEIVQTVGLTTLWSTRVTRGTAGRRLYLVPALAADRLYVADSRGRLVAVAADSGRVLWERDTDLHFSGGPDVKGDRWSSAPAGASSSPSRATTARSSGAHSSAARSSRSRV